MFFLKITEVIFNRKLTHFLVIALICLFLFRNTRKQFFFVFFFPFLFIVHLFIVNYLLVMSNDIHVKAAELSKSATAGIEKFQSSSHKNIQPFICTLGRYKHFSSCLVLTFFFHHHEVMKAKAAVTAEPGKWCHPSSCNHHLKNGVLRWVKSLCR